MALMTINNMNAILFKMQSKMSYSVAVTAQYDSQDGHLCRGHTANFNRGCLTLLAPPTTSRHHSPSTVDATRHQRHLQQTPHATSST